MQKLAIQEGSANYDEDLKVANASEILDVGYTKEDDEIFISLDIAQDDHYITLTFDREQFFKAVFDALLHPEDA